MKQFKKDVLHWKDYDFVVINDNLEKCYNKIIAFLDKKMRGNIIPINHDQNQIEQHIKLLLN